MSGKYIVVFKDGVTEKQIDAYIAQLDANGGQVSNRYNPDILNGFSASIPDQFLRNLQGDDAIAYIEPDGIVTTQ